MPTRLIYIISNNKKYSLFLWGQNIKKGLMEFNLIRGGKKNTKEF